jgi:hypothetical protein
MTQWKQADNADRAYDFMQKVHPDESFEVGDCPNCGYTLTDEEKHDAEYEGDGYVKCPQCGAKFNLYEPYSTRAGITKDQMGRIGEDLIDQFGTLPNVGQVIQSYAGQKNWPIDCVIQGVDGVKYGVEIKTNHYRAQARFKIGGEWTWDPDLNKTVPPRAGKYAYCKRNGLAPALIGVRLNFLTNHADVFWRSDGFIDTWIGNAKLVHVGTFDFSSLNPFKNPSDVPPSSQLPDDDSDTGDDGIPF